MRFSPLLIPYQNDPYFRKNCPDIYLDGCYFMDLLAISQFELNRVLTCQEIENVYEYCERMQYIKSECYVMQSAKIVTAGFMALGSKIQAIKQPEEYDYICGFSRTAGGGHWRLFNRDEALIYDSWDSREKDLGIAETIKKTYFFIG